MLYPRAWRDLFGVAFGIICLSHFSLPKYIESNNNILRFRFRRNTSAKMNLTAMKIFSSNCKQNDQTMSRPAIF